jgi:PIN domain nuclease of toxin-antitoxin system
VKSAPLAVLDASPVLAWIFQERGHEAVDKLLPYAAISTVNLAEVLRHATARGYRRPAADLRDDLEALGLALVAGFTGDDAVRAQELVNLSYAEKHLHGDKTLALADAVCVAVAERLGVKAVVTGDRLWKDLGHHLHVPVQLFR